MGSVGVYGLSIENGLLSLPWIDKTKWEEGRPTTEGIFLLSSRIS